MYELLLDYSASYKRVDRNFIDHVLDLYWNGLKNYLEHVSYDRVEQDVNDPNSFDPMAYSFYEKKIVIDEDVIEKNFPKRMWYFQKNGLDEFGRILSYNVEQLYSLLHEIDHSFQYKKGIESVDTFEGLLMSLCFYPEIEVLGKASLKTLLLLVINRSKFVPRMENFNNMQVGFDRDVPFERLADIHACEKINKLLERVDADIDKVRSFFSADLVQYLVSGYDENSVVPFPTVRYIAAFKSLNIPEVN